jgi:hypothetical protein
VATRKNAAVVAMTAFRQSLLTVTICREEIMTQRSVTLAIFLITGMTIACLAQEKLPPLPNLDRSYIANALPHDELGLIFEAQIAPNFTFASTRLGATVPRNGWMGALTATPMVLLRMSDERSRPIRTPSYMPKLTGQLLQVYHAEPSWTTPVHLLEFQGIIGHHSNGQDGCLFDETLREGSACPDAIPDDEKPHVNRTSGAFGTNYYQLGFHYGLLRFDAGGANVASLTVGGYYKRHPEGFLKFGAIRDPLYSLYGARRVGLEAELERCVGTGDTEMCDASTPFSGRLLTGIRFEYLVGAPEYLRKHPYILSGELAYTLSRLNGLGVFARGYMGQDYYNLGFSDIIHVVHVGITFARPHLNFTFTPPEKAPEPRLEETANVRFSSVQ